MRAGHDVGDDLGLGGIRHGWLEHAHDGRHSPTEAGVQPDGLADEGWVTFERRPETIGQHHRAGCIRAVVARVEQPADHWTQPHHVEIRASDDPRAELARLAEPDHSEPDS